MAAALERCRLATSCFVLDAAGPLTRDGISWRPVDGVDDRKLCDADAVVLDTYLHSAELIAAVPPNVPLIVLQEQVAVPPRATLVVNVGADPASAGSGRLYGFEFACLREQFWQAPAKEITERVGRVLVTTGGGDAARGLGAELATAVRSALPDARVALVRGPHGTVAVPAGVELVDAPETLYEQLLSADLVITAGGQTMLEAAAVGLPALVVVVASNQSGQATRLAELGGVVLIEGTADHLGRALGELESAERRRALGAKARSVVDGRGAERIARRIAGLVGGV